ncbi:MAG TPA: alpha/beta hydrolase [Streptosporangiaceae bacterium]|nr:alpha/beta hydrolase [Streptosporangiaceae bacterium]
MQPEVAPAELSVPAAAGRRLQVLVSGPEGGLPLVFHNGTPSGLVAFGPMVAAAAARGLRMVMYARPGYGASTPDRGRQVADAAMDVAAVLDALGAEQFVTAGWSGGGPHALACAVLLPGRCRGAASIAGVAPYGAAGLDWLAGMAAENVAEFGAALAGEAELGAFLTAAAAGLRGITADQVADGLGGLVSEVDKSVITGEFAGYLAAALSAAVSTGTAGWRDDDLAFVRDWGFVVDQGAPVTVWQGDQDMMVPFAHGQWLAAHVPGARVHLVPGAGHLSLGVAGFGSILDDLLSIAGTS